jgi:predicted GIY-YIG superfamily endonuclease
LLLFYATLLDTLLFPSALQLALLTARRFGLPETIIARAEYLAKYWVDNIVDNSNDAAATSSLEHSSDLPPKASVREVLEELGDRSSVFIPPLNMPPPSYEGSSCVYILELEGPRYYVGETDSLARRLSEHRSRGKEWEVSSATAIKVEGGKSSARTLEYSVIQRLAKQGFILVSDADGRRPR